MKFFKKEVLSQARGLSRVVYYSNRTNRQIAIVSQTVNGKGLKLSVPIEGMGGWHVECRSVKQAEAIISRECSFFGKLYNRVFTVLSSLLKGTLS